MGTKWRTRKGPIFSRFSSTTVKVAFIVFPSDTAITTNPLVTLQLRQATYGILQCTVHIKARRVSWMKGTTSSANESLDVMESNKNISERSGNGYGDGKYKITQEYSLVIKELQLHHEGKTFSVSYKALVSEIVSLLQHEAQMDFEALEQRVNEVLMQHYRRISDFSDKKCTTTANEILTEIRAALCDTHQMLIDWRESQTSTRIKEMIEIKTEPAYAWPSDEELNTISRNLTPDSMKKVCKKLKIDSQRDDTYDEEKRLKTLRKWRTKASAKPSEDKWKQLFSALESNKLEGLLPTLRGPYIYKAELFDLAFHLLIHDLLPITKELGIDATKLVSYRPAFHPSHLESSTINLLIKIYASIRDTSLTKPERLTFCKKIANSKYDSDAITGVFDYNKAFDCEPLSIVEYNGKDGVPKSHHRTDQKPLIMTKKQQ
eukprot:XP_011668564.1 PREDICTED: uncharacterized protein LOC105440288 [Strongylocentrotus purpuratus]